MVTVSPQVAGLAPTIGRDSELGDLHQAFLAGTAVQILTGMGGVGKTSLARAYAQRHLDDYTIVWWVRAEDSAAIDAEFRSLLEVLLPPGEALKIIDARTKAFDLLAHDPGPWLLVLDNVPDAASSAGLLPPTNNGHILITSRSTDWPTSSTVQPLATDASVELLTTQSGDRDEAAAKTLATELGGLPLALTQAAGFARTNGIDLTTYLRLYRDRSADLHKEGRPPDYPQTVATTWQLAIDELSATARAMLNILAFYAPDAIPLQRLLSSATSVDKIKRLADELTQLRALGELRALSLVNPAATGTVTVHRLVQAVTRDRLLTEMVAHEWAEIARTLITEALPQQPVTATSIATWNMLHTHVRAVVGHLPAHQIDTMTLWHELANWTGYAGDAAQARDLFTELLAIRTPAQGPEHPDTLRTQHDVGYWTGWANRTGDAAKTRDLFADLLLVRERVLGANHPDTLLTQHELAVWTGYAGDSDNARDQLSRILSTREHVLGPDHPDILIHRNNIAYWTGRAGDTVRARDLFAELLPIREQLEGADHPLALVTRRNLAHWTGEAGDAARARDLFAELLRIRERVLGADHPHTRSTVQELEHWTEQASISSRNEGTPSRPLPA